jgi:hypothetical protein
METRVLEPLENPFGPKVLPKRYVGPALLQDRLGGRIHATKSDHLVRYLQIPGLHGPVEIAARGSKQASELARYKDRRRQTDNTLKGFAQKELLPYSLYLSTEPFPAVQHERSSHMLEMLKRSQVPCTSVTGAAHARFAKIAKWA